MLIYFILLLLFAVDRLSKLIFILKASMVSSLGGFINFSINKNMAFSWPMSPWLFYPTTVVVLCLLFFYADKSRKNKSIILWPWSLIIIGAISNLLDRFYYGGVVDFLSWPNFFVFNLADIYISIGVVWILGDILFKPKGK